MVTGCFPRNVVASVSVELFLPFFNDLCAMPRLAESFVRAYLYADGAVAANADLVRTELFELFANALGGEQPTRHHQEVGALIADVWSTKVLTVTQNRTTVGDLLLRLTHSIVIISVHDNNQSADLGSQ